MGLEDAEGLTGRIASRGEDALGKVVQELLENPLVNGAIARAFDARERAAQAQEVAMGALNLPSASDIERLTRRLRSVSQRLEGIEDAVDRLDRRLAEVASSNAVAERLADLDADVRAVSREVGDLRKATTAKPRADSRRRSTKASKAGSGGTSRGAGTKRAGGRKQAAAKGS